MAAANSLELEKYGISVGLTNYPAAYCTGLLVARRVLTKLGMSKMYEGNSEMNGEDYDVSEEGGERRPFKALLDVGLVRTTTGNKVFGALKGACDGGIHVPHSPKRFPNKAGGDGEEELKDAAAHRMRILGGHVKRYMDLLEKEDPDRFKIQFSEYIKKGVSASQLESMYTKAHAAIRANPVKEPKKERAHPPVHIREGIMIKTSKASYPCHKKITLEQRKARVFEKMRLLAEQTAAEME
eukprot:GHVN01030114.1.p1 GENE.GHVN01030114.1~~GHVN01030114.1.p1  ORF type:complete len:279 (-),score=41.59 GHVN01030114.1:241-960(-)